MDSYSRQRRGAHRLGRNPALRPIELSRRTKVKGWPVYIPYGAADTRRTPPRLLETRREPRQLPRATYVPDEAWQECTTLSWRCSVTDAG